MRQIKGYICAARIENTESQNLREYVLFGKRQDIRIKGDYEALATNNLSPYESLSDAELGQHDLIMIEDFDRVEIRKLELVVAESSENLNSFENETSLIVIWETFMGKQLVGTYIGGRGLGGVPGEYITRNGFKPFEEFKRANLVRSEARRQSESSPATLAKFKISRPLRVIERRKK